MERDHVSVFLFNGNRYLWEGEEKSDGFGDVWEVLSPALGDGETGGFGEGGEAFTGGA